MCFSSTYDLPLPICEMAKRALANYGKSKLSRFSIRLVLYYVDQRADSSDLYLDAVARAQ